jgi:hypothetical protein
VAIRPVDVTCAMTERDLGLYARRMGPVGERLARLDGVARAEVERRVDAAFLPWVDKGEARFTAACWMVTARAWSRPPSSPRKRRSSSEPGLDSRFRGNDEMA